ncbi:N-6 DNA methylase [Phycisphaeraceae bacterium D3-23]
MLRRIAALEIEGLKPEDYHLPPSVKLNEAISQSWSRILAFWKSFSEAREKITDDDETGALITRERWLLPLFQELGYGRLTTQKSPEIDGKVYPIERFWQEVPIHLVGCKLSMDRRAKGVRGAATASPHSLVQEYLNRSDDHLWAFVSNGLQLRILRDNLALSRQSFVEFDLEAMLEGEVYADFALLWVLCHQSRLEGDMPEDCWLEKWSKVAREQGTRILSDLRVGVTRSIEALGTGFIAHRKNDQLRSKLESGELSTQDYYRQLLRIVYRLLFLFVAEDRDLLHSPDAEESACSLYDANYSTRHFRYLADTIRGSKHADLWHIFSLVSQSLAQSNGCPELGLPGLGSFLWSGNSTPDLLGPAQAVEGQQPVLIRNMDLLDAVRKLAFIERDNTLRAVDYRNLGSEELGSVYESLLELNPDIDLQAKAFSLRSASGNERKTTGSYYTPDSLVQCLLDSALDPVVEDRIKEATITARADGTSIQEAHEQAILNITVCDPACGSGHFLIAAAHRLAYRLASTRTGETQPTPEDHQHALRDVIRRCVFGVDINPMAAELCKVALWMESLEPGKPLTFLDAHIQVGNSLLGTTPRLMAGGIPDDAFKPIEGDDKKIAAEYKKRNKQERKKGGKGQTSFLAELRNQFPVDLGNMAQTIANLDQGDADSVEAVLALSERYVQAIQSQSYRDARLAADAWCAAFVWKKDKRDTDGWDAITEEVFANLTANPHSQAPWLREEVQRLEGEYQFFHWHLAFPQIFRLLSREQREQSRAANKLDEWADADNTDCGWNGGFDVILGNPPWDTMSPDVKEFFSAFDPDIRSQDKAGQQAIVDLLLDSAEIKSSWESHRRYLYSSVHYIKNSGRYNMFAKGNLGKGDFNIYRMFVETALTTVASKGTAAQFVPENLSNGPNAAAIRQHLYEQTRLIQLLGFINTNEAWFKDVHTAAKFCLYVSRRGGATSRFPVAFRLDSTNDLKPTDSNRVQMDVTLIRELSPLALAIPELESQEAIDLSIKTYGRWPKFGDTEKWRPVREYMREIDMGNDRHLFNSEGMGVPVYEGRLVGQFDHRAKGYVSGRGRSAVWDDLKFGSSAKCIQPQWWIESDKLPPKVLDRISKYRIGFCDVASPTNERSLVATILPPESVSGHSVPTIVLKDAEPWQYLWWVAAANSFAVDYIVRRKVSLHLNYSILDSIPIPNPSLDTPGVRRCVQLSAQLVCCGDEMQPLWADLQQRGWVEDGDGQFVSEESRLAARAEIDVIVAKEILGLTTTDMKYVLDDFPTTAKYEIARWGSFRSRERILSMFENDSRRTTVEATMSHDNSELMQQATLVPSSCLETDFSSPATLIRSPEIEHARLVEAFRSVREGRSVDYIIAEPALNRSLQKAAIELGIRADAEAVNLALLDARKRGRLTLEETSERFALPARYKPYVFVSQNVLRAVQRSLHNELGTEPSIDRILCNPGWAARFDDLASEVTAHIEQFDPIEFRWAVLFVRKRNKSWAEREATSILNHQGNLFMPDVPGGAGIYRINHSDGALFISATKNLQDQISRHELVGQGELIHPKLWQGLGRPTEASFLTSQSLQGSTNVGLYRMLQEKRPPLNILEEAI